MKYVKKNGSVLKTIEIAIDVKKEIESKEREKASCEERAEKISREIETLKSYL